MKLCIIFCVLFVLAIIACFVMAYLSWDPEAAVFLAGIPFVLLCFTAVVMVTSPIEAKRNVSEFEKTKTYIEEYVPGSEYDAAAILNKKVELNQWLFDVQYTKENYPLLSFYSDDILDLEPIK